MCLRPQYLRSNLRTQFVPLLSVPRRQPGPCGVRSIELGDTGVKVSAWCAGWRFAAMGRAARHADELPRKTHLEKQMLAMRIDWHETRPAWHHRAQNEFDWQLRGAAWRTTHQHAKRENAQESENLVSSLFLAGATHHQGLWDEDRTLRAPGKWHNARLSNFIKQLAAAQCTKARG